jgi:hypothetical protein
MARSLRVADREKTAERLLNSSADRFYDPEVDIDWAAPLAEDKYFIPRRRSSLYGTALWDGLTEAQRIELTRHELASVASVGLWFEIILMRMLVKAVYNSDPTTRHAQYALTEVADECRHSTMFARLVERVGCPAYGPKRFVHRLAKLLPTIGYGPAMYGSILVAEEVLDRMQREAMQDEQVQPLVRMVNRIHVLEEARHVRFAREEVVRGMARMGRTELMYQRELLAAVGLLICRSIINPRVYAAVGIDPKAGERVALANPHYRDTLHWSGERIMSFLDEVGLVGHPGMSLWRKSFLVR